MKKLIAFVIVLGLSAITILLRFIVTPILNRFSEVKRSSQDRFTVLGKVTAIENDILSLKEPKGQIFKVAATGDKLKGIHVGDRVILTRV